MTDFSRFAASPDMLLDGSRARRGEPLALRAGPLTLQFENGGLRYIRLAKREVVRRVYCAVRDANWGTVPDQITMRRTEVGAESFEIEFDVANCSGDIDFTWRGTIIGQASGRITFEFDGVANSTFSKNRIGVCVLHPMALAGMPVLIEHADGSTQQAEFPRFIAAHNPFLEVVGLRHAVEPGVDVAIRFEGDLFETEDQRNWIDASFKTFCTPLSRPFPVEVPAGERIYQCVTIELAGRPPTKIGVATSGDAVTLELAGQAIGPLPTIGFSLSVDGTSLTSEEIGRLRRLRPAYLRCELRLAHEFASRLRPAATAAKELNTALELALFVEPEAERELEQLVALTRALQPPIARWTVFPAAGWSTTRELAELAIKHLREYDPQIPIGGGTPANFRELNSTRPSIDVLDFIAWSLTPQIHAFDNASLVETLAAHSVTVESARQFAAGLPLVVGPVTFKMQVNPYATGPWPPSTPPGELSPKVDSRQMSLFGAAWTLSSLKYLAESQVHAATYYDLVGEKGLMQRAGHPTGADMFPAPPGAVYPLYHVFADLAELSAPQVLPVKSSDPLRVEGLAIASGPQTRLLVANLTGMPQTLELPLSAKSAHARSLDLRHVRAAMTDPETYRATEKTPYAIITGRLKLDLSPFSTHCIDLTWV